MTEGWCFYQLKDCSLIRKGYSFPPFPVHCQSVQEVFRSEKVNLHLLLEELDQYLTENPKFREMYLEAIHIISEVLIFELGEEENNDRQKMVILQIGLKYNPSDEVLHINRAIVLHANQQYAEALSEYKNVMARSGPSLNPLLWILVSRLYAEIREYRLAYETLEECSPYISRDFKEFWNFLQDMEQIKGGIKRESPAGSNEFHCPYCQVLLPAHAKFCRKCGNPVNKEAT